MNGVLMAASTSVSAEPAGAPKRARNVTVISAVTVGVPDPPNGNGWDTAIAGILTFNLKNIQPDVRVCMESTHVPMRCTAICQDADWSEERNAYVCAQPTGPAGLLLEKDLHVVVEEIDPGSKRQVAEFPVKDPSLCKPCTFQTQGGTLWIEFEFASVPTYTGPFRATRGTIPPPPTLPPAQPSSGGSAPPPSARRPTPADIEQGLADLRAKDTCVGRDHYFPDGTVYTRNRLAVDLPDGEATKLYHLAAFATAINDPQAKQLILAKIQNKIADDDIFKNVFMAIIMPDTSRSKELHDAFRGVTAHFAKEIAAKFLPALQPETLMPDIERWVLRRLMDSSAEHAVDLMFSNSTLSAECALNQLAKEGFIDAMRQQ
jgi:hypothetical protein